MAEWEDKGKYLEANGPIGRYRIFRIRKRSRWVLEIHFKDWPDNIPEQRFFYSKNAALTHGNALIDSEDPNIYDKDYHESGRIKEK